MTVQVERAVAAFLGEPAVKWEKLRPIACFVVLWNRLEQHCGRHLNLRKLEDLAERVGEAREFDVAPYRPAVTFFRDRYSSEPDRLASLVSRGGRPEPYVSERIERMVSEQPMTSPEFLKAILMIPYRIRNNLFHGNKSTFELYDQTELFNHVNLVLCQFHEDLS